MDYCVYKTTYTGKLLPPYYIGSTSLAKIERGYRGSVCSKKYKDIWKQELKDNPELFSTKILVKCETRKEALVVELEIQQEYDVVINPFYINQSFARKNGFFGMDNSGYKHSEEAKALMSEKQKGRICSEETKALMSEKKKGHICSEETKALISEKMKGHKHSEEAKALMSEKKKDIPIPKITCPYCGLEISISNLPRHITARHQTKKS